MLIIRNFQINQFPQSLKISNTKIIKIHKQLILPHTSDLVENLLNASPSGAVHLMGNFAPACAVYVSSFINRAKPKSATFTRWLSPTKQFLAAKSLERKTLKSHVLRLFFIWTSLLSFFFFLFYFKSLKPSKVL